MESASQGLVESVDESVDYSVLESNTEHITQSKIEVIQLLSNEF